MLHLLACHFLIVIFKIPTPPLPMPLIPEARLATIQKSCVAALALGLVLVLTGLMARHLGGGRQAQVVAALAAAIGGVAFSGGTFFMYVSFDYLLWVAAAYFMVRLLASDDPR